MSIGAPSTLGTLLVQRLDAVLGTTLSQQANLVSGARPDAVSQPADADSTEAGRNELVRHPREAVDRSTAQAQQGARRAAEQPEAGARFRTGGAAANALHAGGTPSAPTRLGFAARTILALLAEFPDQAPPVAGKTLLTGPPAQASKGAATQAMHAPARPEGTAPQSGARTTAMAAQPAAAGSVAAGQAVPTASALAGALAHALQTSGLFYEAHLADLAFGKRPAAALAAEPQSQLGEAARNPPQGRQAPDAATPRTAATSQPGTPPSHTALPSTDAQADGSRQQAATPAGTASHTAQAGANQLPPAMHVLVRQQLEVLANQAFAWQGEAWPNAPLHWEVRRDDGAWPDTPQGGRQHWATRIRISLPRLGMVDARLNLVDSQLLLQLSAPDCADTLESSSQILRRRLGDAGLVVEQLAIDADMPQAEAADTKMANE
jgi:hypothetical protein